MFRDSPKRHIPILAASCFVAVFQPWPAQAAYIDPATTSYIIQVVSGLVITLSVAIGVFFRKIQLFFMTLSARLSAAWIRLTKKRGRKSASKAANHDRKISTSPRTHTAREAGLSRTGAKPTRRDLAVSKRAFLWAEQRSWKVRLGLSAVSAFALTMVFPLYTGLDLFAGNYDQFQFTIADLVPALIVTWLASGTVLTLVVFALRGRVLDAMISLVVGLTLSGWLQANFLNPDFGTIMGQDIDWGSWMNPTLANLGVWVCIFSFVFCIRLASRKVWTWLVTGVAILVLTGSVVSLGVTYSALPETDSSPGMIGYYSWNNALSVSSAHNEIVFVMDALDGTYIDEILESDPDFFDPLGGATWYTQNMSRYSQTNPAILSMLTGEDYYFDIPRGQYQSEAWRDADVLLALKDAGYSINIYSDKYDTYSDDEDILGLVDNFVPEGRINPLSMVGGIAHLSAFIDAPMVAKPTFWVTSPPFRNLMRTPPDAPAPYYIDDDVFHRKLADTGLSVRGSQPQFSFIHLDGSHAPWKMNADGWTTDATTSAIIQTKGAFSIIFEYVEELKRLGVYEDSTIIITGDHGAHVDLGTHWTRVLNHPILSGLLVKPRGRNVEPLAVSVAPVSQDNLLPTLAAEAGLDAGDAGLAYADVPIDSTEPRTYIWYRTATDVDAAVGNRYEVVGDAREWENWTLVETFPMEE